MTARRRLLPLALLPLLAACQGHLPPLETQPHTTAGPAEPPNRDVRDIVNHVQCELYGIIAQELQKDEDDERFPVEDAQWHALYTQWQTADATWKARPSGPEPVGPGPEPQRRIYPTVSGAEIEQAVGGHPIDKLRASEDGRLKRLRDGGLLKYLIDDHFVATVQLNLDVADTEGFTPSLAFIRPLAGQSSPNRTTSLGGAVTSTQDRSVNVGYSVDVATMVDNPPTNCAGDLKGVEGIGGNLGLVDII